MTNSSEIFTESVLRAILLRKKELDREYYILSKFMKAYGMENYASVAENLILDDEGISFAIDKENVILDLFKKDIWLDNVALYMFADILEGFIDKSQYRKFLEYTDSFEKIRRINNQSLEFYRSKGLTGLMLTVIKHHQKYVKLYPEQTRIIYKWCVLELLSRTGLPKAYYFIKELPTKVKLKSATRYLRKQLDKIHPVEGS